MNNLAIKETTEEKKNDVTSFMNKHWQKFFAKFKQIETVKISDWTELHLLAYICKRYEEVFNLKFVISVKGAPGKCTEMYQTKMIMATLQTSDKKIIKEYIDFVFDKKIIPNKVKLQKIGFFVKPGFANEFYLYKKETDVIKRSTSLPDYYIAIANNLEIEAKTYGDLAFIKMAAEKTKDTNNANVRFLNNLEAAGFDLSTLDNLAQ